MSPVDPRARLSVCGKILHYVEWKSTVRVWVISCLSIPARDFLSARAHHTRKYQAHMYVLYMGTATITRQIPGGGGGGVHWKWVVSETHSTTHAYARRRRLLRLKNKIIFQITNGLISIRDIIDKHGRTYSIAPNISSAPTVTAPHRLVVTTTKGEEEGRRFSRSYTI